MPKQYCLCGHPNEYSISKPKFCGGCGKSLEGQSAQLLSIASESAPAPARRQVQSSVPAVRPKVRRRIEQAVDEDFYDDDESFASNEIVVPEKWDMQVTINTVHKEKFENVLGSGGLGSVDVPGRVTKRIPKRERASRLSKLRERLQTTQRHDIGGSGE